MNILIYILVCVIIPIVIGAGASYLVCSIMSTWREKKERKERK